MAARKQVLVPKKSRFHTRNPEYLSASMCEYILKFKELRGWYIHKYNGGPYPKELRGWFSTRDLASKHLIRYLQKTDRAYMARWPGKENIRHTNYTRMFLDG